MIDINAITLALQNMLNSDYDVSQIARVGREEYVNQDPNRCPWLCVYKGPVDYEPRTLGHNNWEAYPKVRVMAQAATTKSGEACGILLEQYIKAIVDAVMNDITIANTVDMTLKFQVDYGYVESDRQSLFFQSALITFDLEVQT